MVLIFLLSSFFILTAQNDEGNNNADEVDVYTIYVGFNLKMFKVNDTEFFNFYGDVSATVLEIVPMDENTCKIVIAVPWNRAGSFQNYVILILFHLHCLDYYNNHYQ